MNRRTRILKAVIFDFDGVVLESAGIKERAFLRIFSAGRSTRNDILSYLRSVQEKPRWIKIRHVITHILKQSGVDARLKRLVRAYEKECYRRVLACRFVKGAERLIRRGDFLKFVCSGTPEAELRRIITHRGLASSITASFGAPRRKPDILKIILRRWSLPRPAVLYVGDSIGDYRASLRAGVPFIGRTDPRVPDMFKDCDIPTVRDLDALSAHLQDGPRRAA